MYDVRKMTPAVVEAHQQAFRKDKSTSVRLAALSHLAKVRKQNPAVQKLIEEAAKSDPVKDVKERAQGLLE